MKRPEGMPKARVFGAGVDLPGKAHLLDSPQALKRSGIEDGGERAVLAYKLHESVHGIPEDSIGEGRLRHTATLPQASPLGLPGTMN